MKLKSHNLTEEKIFQLGKAENTHRRGKDHFMASLQFYNVALDFFTKYK